jgi:hypothetical protein
VGRRTVQTSPSQDEKGCHLPCQVGVMARKDLILLSAFFFFFSGGGVGNWGLNSGTCICEAGPLQLESHF